MSQTGIAWGFGEVVSTANAFNQKTEKEEKKKRNAEGKAVGQNIADAKYRGEIEVTMNSGQGGIPGGLSGDTITAYPSSMNFTRIPLVGEHVIMYQGPGAGMGSAPPDTKTGDKKTGVGFDTEWFYLPPISIRGNVEANMNPGANAGGIGGSNQTIQDGQQKKKSEAYVNTESGNPSVVNKTPANSSINSSARTINDFPDYSKGELSDKDIAEFQELEQKILDMNNPESPTYQRVYYNANSESEAEDRVEDQIDKYEKKIERFKEQLVERGFVGDFVESEGDIDTITGYLGLVPEQQQAKADEQAQREAEIAGRNPNPNTSKQGGGGGGGRNQNKLTTPPGIDFVEKGNIGNLQPYEGDFLLQGRMGQSIRFGSQTTPKDPELYVQPQPWEKGDAPEGSPITVIRNGQSTSAGGGASNNFVVEDINGDHASVYLTSGQKLPISVASPTFDAIDNVIRQADSPTYNDSNGNPVPSWDCNGVSGPIEPVINPNVTEPVPEDCSKLTLIDLTVEYFDTAKGSPTRGKVMGTDRLRMIQKWPVLEQYSCIILQLFQAAEADGVYLTLNSGFRGIHQINHPTTGKKLASGQLNCRYACAINRSWATEANKKDRSSPLWRARSSKFKPYVAIPGYSRHQNGTAIDINYKDGRDRNHDSWMTVKKPKKLKRTSTTDTDGVYAWLIANTYKFGFVRTVSTEEWHFEYAPDKAAKGPFGGLKPGSSNRWHGLDKKWQDGVLGPNKNNTWNTNKGILPKDHPWGDSGIIDNDGSFFQAAIEIGSFGLLGDDDGQIG
jgi:LAS superfamily LD-carboxypeptidase LdcB